MAAVSALRQDPGEPSEDCFDGDHSFEDIGLAAGWSQQEKKRSYTDFLREEEEITAQVRNSSKKRLKDSELYFLGMDKHKKRKHSSDDYYYGGQWFLFWVLINQGEGGERWRAGILEDSA